MNSVNELSTLKAPAVETTDEAATVKFLSSYDIPTEKEDPVVRKIVELRSKHRGMSHDRVLRKVAEFYHLKKKPADENL